MGRFVSMARAAALASGVAACTSGGGRDTGTVDTGPATDDDDGGSTTFVPTDDDTGIDTGTSATGTSSSSDEGGAAETACEEVTWYLDMDGDGRGDPNMPTLACDPPPDHVAFDDDCDDTDPDLSPAATELCDGIDNDCDALVDEHSTMNSSCNGCELFELDEHFYAFCPEPLAWDAARTSCGAFAADLIAIDDEAEQTAMIGFDEPMPVGLGGWYIGLSDVTTRGTFAWPDGSAPAFTPWGEGEPNDAGGNEDCVELDFAVGLWNDLPCTDVRAYICESVPARTAPP